MNRLRTDRDFDRVFKRGRSVYGNGFSLRSAPNDGKGPRFAFVVSTKVSKKAVVRNRIRRRMREIVRRHLPEIRKNIDIVVMAKKDVVDHDFSATKAAVEGLLVKAGILKKNDKELKA